METKLCPKYAAAFELLGKRWIGMIIKVLFEGTCRFKDINSEIPNISQKVLTDRLKELEENGIVYREVLDEKPVKVLYSLTKKGRELEPVMEAVQGWAVKWVK
ncbi:MULTISPECIES: helix-turn-helix domain-containing protein [Rossellomorea]|jgi:DNA-binding HxlR family transcriptional regulator|uniref:Helix-turn-helix transcriptional regulator n=1 Tax=Rossellomorea aquimaris TaxID=189382 RepID=A0A5D4UD44_9BACI|nr:MULTISPECIES: helix-turn-helix domain-containing protein [Rossellomorea]MDT9023366.1 helix-turn-helix domain-containing protein [Rossellomorea sp. YC4-1]TYS80001.1 helix-turn-helix transcriptional regulator [Rossellomorea aquimaris]TYS85387.1 helix-turn-helix transcriptional regulator [Rossellomorea aquimaris]